MKIYDESGYIPKAEDDEFVEIKLPSEYKTLLDNQTNVELADILKDKNLIKKDSEINFYYNNDKICATLSSGL
jgi:hypothetical protein